jgi:hypothetical protein
MSPLFVLVAGCAGGRMTSSFTSPANLPQPDVFGCLRKEIPAQGWSQESYDTGEYRVTARKYDLEARRPDVQFRRLVHRLYFNVAPGSGDQVTTVTVEASTHAEYTTQRGPTELQEPTAPAVIEAGRKMAHACGGASTESSTP